MRIEWHIRAPGLENRQHPDHQRHSPLSGNANPHFRADTALAQFAGQAIGLGVERCIGQRIITAAQRQGVRVQGGLRLEQLVQGWPGRLHLNLRVPVRQQRLLLVRTQQGQLSDTLLGCLHHRAQQVQPVPGQALNGRGVIHIAGVGQAGVQALALFFGVQRQIELRRVLLPVHALNAQARQLPLDALADLPLMVEQHLKQRAVAQAALRLQRVHQLLERQVLMRLCPQGVALDLLQQAGKGLLAVDLAAQHLGVDKEADQAFGFELPTPGIRHPDIDRRLTAVAMQQGLITGQQQHKQRDIVLLRQLP